MANAVEFSDSLSNTEEQIEKAAKTIGRSIARRKVFDAIYHHKSKIKTVGELAEKTGLRRIRVLQEGRHLYRKGIVRQTKRDGDTAYEKIDFFHAHKQEILRYVKDPKKLARLPTKRKLGKLPSTIRLPSFDAKAIHITVDDVDSFSKVKKVRVGSSLGSAMTEEKFKQGIKAIIGEPGTFKDWGGEKSDLYSTRIRMKGKRTAAAFAFKGPGQKGKLVIGKMGKNGDQAPRLFQEDAQIFFVQHWREIDSSVLDLMRNLAVAKSLATGRRVFYGVIDGYDSERLRLAYPQKFGSAKIRR